ncbi:MAG: transglycosylase domain-containing protein [Lachnospiraceae bacterium]|nr:transglycosylase domain-containing protein [Lachnospiraceae bacterium]
MNYSKRENNNRRLLRGNYGDKLYSKVWLYAIRIACVGFLAGCFALAGVLLGTFMGLMDGVPEITLDALAISGETSRIVDQDGNLITEIYTAEQRTSVAIENMPQDLIHALVAVEDKRFFEHDGIDLEGILRAGVSVIKSNSASQGGSTITQQMIKKLVLTPDQNLKRKIQEWYLALTLEDMMSKEYGKERTKELILESYLNYNYLGNSCYGVETASLRYFGKHVGELTTGECALLAGLFNAPSAFDPLVNYNGAARKRQLVVLDAMLANGYLTDEEYQAAKSEPVLVQIRAHNAAYEADDSNDVYSYFVDSTISAVQDDLVEKLGLSSNDAYNMVYHGGITIYITQDSRIQGIIDDEFSRGDLFQDETYYELSYALTIYDEKDRNITENFYTYGLFYSEEECRLAAGEYRDKHVTPDMVKGVDYVENITITEEPQYSMTIIDQHNGHIVAMAGGRGKKTANLSINRAMDSTRQPGSTFKILASYSAALDVGGFYPGATMDDSYMQWDDWIPGNWWGTSKFLGFQTMRRGIANSENIVTSKFMRAVGVETNFDYVESYGISTLRREPDEDGLTDMVGSLCLGSGSVKNYELTAAYAAIANDGVYIEPTLYTKITDTNGNVLFENVPETHRVIKETTAYLLTDMMRDNITGANEGSATACNFDYYQYTAGKTGTTSDANDYAFVGYTNYYTCAIQSGFDYVTYPEIYYESLGHSSIDPNGAYLLSYSAHKDLWRVIMGRVHEPLETISYWHDAPEGITWVSTCLDSGLYAGPYCERDQRGSRVNSDICDWNSMPQGSCNRHIELSVCKESGQIATPYCTDTEKRVFLIRFDDEIAEITAGNLYKIEDFPYCAYPWKYAGGIIASINGFDPSSICMETGSYTPTYFGECHIHTSEKKAEEESSETSEAPKTP